jgi:hypothetical protein
MCMWLAERAKRALEFKPWVYAVTLQDLTDTSRAEHWQKPYKVPAEGDLFDGSRISTPSHILATILDSRRLQQGSYSLSYRGRRTSLATSKIQSKYVGPQA